MSNGNVIDSSLMSTTQWISLCIALIVATNSVNLVLADINAVKKEQANQNELHIKDVEIMLHKLKAKTGRDDTSFESIWVEINKLKDGHKSGRD